MKLFISVFISILCGISSLFVDEISNNAEVNNTNVKIIIKGIRSDKGKIVLAVFKDQEGFKSRKPVKRIELNKDELEKNEIQLNLDMGIYGISVFDDENDNNKMDYNFFGIPKEGFGFSNYYHKGYSKPHFDKFKFVVIKDNLILIEIQLRYM
ncbi:hypothetical protein A9Q87_01405 [Flavobacteriales bacterium 34_180_T64]|nr:hypothetical protein A9Q87_01405 [Flavobacteriales bacterium 34_180_T64]